MNFGVGFTIFKPIWKLDVLELQNKQTEKTFGARQGFYFYFNLFFFSLKLVKTSHRHSYGHCSWF